MYWIGDSPSVELGLRFQLLPGFWIPQAKISRFQQGKLSHPRDPVEGVQVLRPPCFNSRLSSRFREQFYSVVVKDWVIVKGHETRGRVCSHHSTRIVQCSHVNTQALWWGSGKFKTWWKWKKAVTECRFTCWDNIIIKKKYSSTPIIWWKFSRDFRTHPDPFICDDVLQPYFDEATKLFNKLGPWSQQTSPLVNGSRWVPKALLNFKQIGVEEYFLTKKAVLCLG